MSANQIKLRMDLPVDVLQLVVEYLPKFAQYALIGDTPVGRHSCNQFYKYIEFGAPLQEEDYHPAFHTLNAIEESFQSHYPMFVKSYEALKAQYPFHQPGEIRFEPFGDLRWFCEEYGDEIHKFKAIDIELSPEDISRGALDKIPVLSNVRKLTAWNNLDCSFAELAGKFRGIKELVLSNQDIDMACFPGIESLMVSHLSDFSMLGLKSLYVTDSNLDFHREFLPSTLKHLRIKMKNGKLDFIGLHLTSLDIRVDSSVNYTQSLFESSLPQTLRTLSIHVNNYNQTHDLVLGPPTEFPNLRYLYGPAEVWNCMITPNIRNLSIHGCRSGRLKSIDASKIEGLTLTNVILDDDFQLPSSLERLGLNEVKIYRGTETIEALMEDNSVTLPESLISFGYSSTSNFDITKNILAVDNFDFLKSLLKVTISLNDINLLQSFVDRLPSDVLSVHINCNYLENINDPQVRGNSLDLGRFQKMVRLYLNVEIPQEKIVFPPNVVQLSVRGIMLSSIPTLSHLENLEFLLDTKVTHPLEFPAKLRWLRIGGEGYYYDGTIDLRSSGLKYLEITDELNIKNVILPKTMETLHLHEFSGGNIDSSLCDSFFEIEYSW